MKKILLSLKACPPSEVDEFLTLHSPLVNQVERTKGQMKMVFAVLLLDLFWDYAHLAGREAYN